MKNTNFLFCFGIFSVHATFSQSTTQLIKISNLENVSGDLYIGWYQDAETFRIKDKAIYREKIVVTNQSEVSVTFKNIPKGRYAIAVFLDENNNYRLDKNFIGIPREKYGFSNNVLPALRPATFEESAFELTEKVSNITIRLK